MLVPLVFRRPNDKRPRNQARMKLRECIFIIRQRDAEDRVNFFNVKQIYTCLKCFFLVYIFFKII